MLQRGSPHQRRKEEARTVVAGGAALVPSIDLFDRQLKFFPFVPLRFFLFSPP